jgi:hypothetical protein
MRLLSPLLDEVDCWQRNTKTSRSKLGNMKVFGA